MLDPNQYDENGFPEYLRNIGQNDHYWGYVIGQCVFWHRCYFNQTGDVDYQFKGTDEQLAKLYHERFKKFALLPILHKVSTTKLLEKEYLEYVAGIDCYMAEKKIDIFQFGTKGE